MLSAASVTTLVVTVSGVLLGPAASDPAPHSAKQAEPSQAAAGDVLVARSTPKVALPAVSQQRHVDFNRGDALPDGARVFDSGANPCPPTIVGIGLGGTSDLAAGMAKEASSFRKVGTHNADPLVAQLEAELLDLINQTGIGPQGLGGVTTAMAVNIEWAHTHISQLPVAVNMQCWRGERACAVIDTSGNVTYSN